MRQCLVSLTGSHRVKGRSKRSLRHEQGYVEARVSDWLVVRGHGFQASMARLKHLLSQGPGREEEEEVRGKTCKKHFEKQSQPAPVLACTLFQEAGCSYEFSQHEPRSVGTGNVSPSAF